MRKVIFFILFQGAILISAVAQVARPHISVLIVGNSLSYVNDLPATIEMLADYHELNLQVKCLCKPNYAIADHWNESDFQDLLDVEKVHFVILQQGPSSQEWGGKILLEYGKLFKNKGKMAGYDLAFLMVWPSVQHFNTFDGVVANYSMAAESNSGILIPSGKVWQRYIKETDDFSIYSSDGFHPSRKGSFLVAMTILYFMIPGIEPPADANVSVRLGVESSYYDTVLDLILRERLAR